MTLRYLPWIVFGLPAAVLIGLAFIWTEAPAGNERQPVLVLGAAALRPPLEAAAREYENDYGIKIELQIDASENLLTALRVTGQGDLFIPADDSYVHKAREMGLVEQDYAISTLTTVAVFRADFPKAAKDITWDDVFATGFRLAQPNPATAVGKRTREGLTPSGLWRRIERSKPIATGTVTQAANDVKLGSADGAIIWDAVAAQYPTLKVVHLPHLDDITADVTAAVCTKSKSLTEAQRFAEYLAGPGQKHFQQAGFAKPRGSKK